jgi:outer membrane protein OmpA-like peptidoglycan-associated protein
MNLFEKFEELMDESTVARIAALTDDKTGKTEKALKGIYYTLIAGLIRRGNSNMSATMLHNQIALGGKKGELANNLLAILGNKDKFASTIKDGNKLLSQVFPAFRSPLISMIGTYSDTNKTAATTYSHLMSAVLTDILDERISVEKWNTEGLVHFLREHHQQLLAESPEGLLDVMIPALGLQELKNIRFSAPKKGMNLVADETQEITEIPNREKQNYDSLTETKSFPIKETIIGVLALIILGGGAWWYFKLRTPEPETVEVVEAPPTTSEIVADTVSKIDTVLVPLDTTSNVASGNFTSFGENLVKYINTPTEAAGKTFTMDNVAFLNGGTSLDPESSIIIDELAEILATYPTMQIRIQGYDVAANKAFANKRAYAVKRELLNKGADNNRIDAAGIQEAGKNTVSIKIISK